MTLGETFTHVAILEVGLHLALHYTAPGIELMGAAAEALGLTETLTQPVPGLPSF